MQHVPATDLRRYPRHRTLKGLLIPGRGLLTLLPDRGMPVNRGTLVGDGCVSGETVDTVGARFVSTARTVSSRKTRVGSALYTMRSCARCTPLDRRRVPTRGH